MTLKNSSYAAVLVCLITLSTLAPILAHELETVTGRAMGTSYTLKFANCALSVPKDKVASSVHEELARIESIFSLYRSDSEISRLNSARAGEWIQVSEDLYKVTKFAVQLSQSTGGAFDPTVRPLIELWQSDRLSGDWVPPSREAIEARLQTVGTSQLELRFDPPSIQKHSVGVQLDLNALVEGWAIERVLQLLKQIGCTSALFELGGEYGAMGRKSESDDWRIGIEDPQSLTRVYATVSLNDESLCTSGTYRQVRQYAGKRYSHIVDPRIGYPIEHDLLSVSVLHPNAMIADGWATALMVLGPAKGNELATTQGLVASFVSQSGSSISFNRTEGSDGKILLNARKAELRSWIWTLTAGGLLACGSIVAAWIVFRRRF